MDASIVKVLQAVQEEFPPKRPSSSGSRKSPPLATTSPRSSYTSLPSSSSSAASAPAQSAVRPEASSMAGVSSDPIASEDRSGEMQYDKQGHQNTVSTPSKVSPKPTFMQLPPKSHSNSFGENHGRKTEFGMRGSDNLMLTPARDDLTFIFKKKDVPLAAL